MSHDRFILGLRAAPPGSAEAVRHAMSIFETPEKSRTIGD